MEFQNILNQIDAGHYKEADTRLFALMQKNGALTLPEQAYACMLRGYLHMQQGYGERSRQTAEEMLLENIKSPYPHPLAYVLYADSSKDKNVSLNYLKAGLKKFPHEASIYEAIFRYGTEEDAKSCRKEALEREIQDADLYCKIARQLLLGREGEEGWIEAEPFLAWLAGKGADKREDAGKLLYYKTLHLFSVCMREEAGGGRTQRQSVKGKNAKAATAKETKAKETKARELIAKETAAKDTAAKGKNMEEAFTEILEADMDNSLSYAPCMGLIWCCLRSGNKEKAKSVLQRIPEGNVLSDFFIDYRWNLPADLYPVYTRIFAVMKQELGRISAKLLEKVQTLEALYLGSPGEVYGIYRYEREQERHLKSYWEHHPENTPAACILYGMQRHFKNYFDAYRTFLSLLGTRNKMEEKVRTFDKLDFLNACTPQEEERIYADFHAFLKEYHGAEWKRPNPLRLVTELFDPWVEHLWNQEKENPYGRIVRLADEIEESSLAKSAFLFETAYSYAELDKKSTRAERLYLQIVKTQPGNKAVWNNLGVIHENREELQEACDCFQKAFELEPSKELYRRNIQRVSARIREYEGGLLALKKENAWLKGRLFLLCRAADALGEFTCTYKDRAAMLHVQPQKGEELFEKFLKLNYLFKLPSNGASRYKFNPMVRQFLTEEQKRQEENHIFEKMGEKLNLEEARRMGYTEEVTELLERITDESLREILKRDIFECMVSMLTGQYKSAIVICGSVIEALLVHLLEKSGCREYDIGSLLGKKPFHKPVKDMILNELLEVGRAEKILHMEEYYLSNVVRSYRNIIHPSCEIRRAYQVNEQTAELMWNAMLLMIRQVLG